MVDQPEDQSSSDQPVGGQQPRPPWTRKRDALSSLGSVARSLVGAVAPLTALGARAIEHVASGTAEVAIRAAEALGQAAARADIPTGVHKATDVFSAASASVAGAAAPLLSGSADAVKRAASSSVDLASRATGVVTDAVSSVDLSDVAKSSAEVAKSVTSHLSRAVAAGGNAVMKAASASVPFAAAAASATGAALATAASASAAGIVKAGEMAVHAAKSDAAHAVYKSVGDVAFDVADNAVWLAKHELTIAAYDTAKEAIVTVIEVATESS